MVFSYMSIFFSAYFDLEPPNQIVTVWVALDDMRNEIVGPLQYVKGSHVWKDEAAEAPKVSFTKTTGMC